MGYAYDQYKRPKVQKEAATVHADVPGPDFNALMTGAARPSTAQKGRPINLDAAIKAKMENAFGDLSAVKLYESTTVGRAGAEAMAMGNEIAFAPGMADFSSRSGQERLGHELSHVMSQRTGAVRGEGFLASSALEARADREGAMAAAGEQLYAGPVTSALSSASPSPAVAGPMQAKRRDENAKNVKAMQQKGDTHNDKYATPDYAGYYDLTGDKWEEKVHSPGFSKLWGKKAQKYKVRRDLELFNNIPSPGPEDGFLTMNQSKIDHSKDLTLDLEKKDDLTDMPGFIRPEVADMGDFLSKRYAKGYSNAYSTAPFCRPPNSNEKEGVFLEGLKGPRIVLDLSSDRGRGFNMGKKEMTELFDKLMAPHKEGMNAEEQKKANDQFDEGVKQYKKILLDDMRHMENKYGRMLTQMHPEDYLPQLDNQQFLKENRFNLDAGQLTIKGKRYFDPQKNEEDQEFLDKANYYGSVSRMNEKYNMMAHGQEKNSQDELAEMVEDEELGVAEKLENKIGGPQMDQEEQAAYIQSVQNRATSKAYLKNRLFGRFRPGYKQK